LCSSSSGWWWRQQQGAATGELLGDANSSLGDAKSLLGDAKSSLGDAESSLGDARSSLGDAKSSLGDAKSSLGDAQGVPLDVKGLPGTELLSAREHELCTVCRLLPVHFLAVKESLVRRCLADGFVRRATAQTLFKQVTPQTAKLWSGVATVSKNQGAEESVLGAEQVSFGKSRLTRAALLSSEHYSQVVG
jgi:hypothetical protein